MPPDQTTNHPPIVVRVKASTYSGPYRLEWDWNATNWVRIDEPGEPLGPHGEWIKQR